ncbi:MAG: carboxypeptidase regulatory-like domain-containing protein [Planctomycetales bacterium]|nr:carboxypeptidase regulatory-like domain-containing protein [Planctomycetales bacterium]
MNSRVGLFVSLAAVLFTGCGSDLPPLAPLTGKITADGKPYANGSLMFSPVAGGRPSVAKTDENGEFEAMYQLNVPGAIIGKHTVMFEAAGSDEPLSEEDEMNLHKRNPGPPKDLKINPKEVEVLEDGTVVNFTL